MTDITKLPLFVIREMWLDGKLSDADYTAEVQRRNDEIKSLRSRAEKAEAELATSNKIFCSMLTTGVCDLPDRLMAAEATCEKLANALQNVMGVYDTPLSRRRFPPDDFMREALETARVAIAAYRKEASE